MAKVFFIKLADNTSLSEQVKATKILMQAAGFDETMKKQDKVAVKIHVGEKNNVTHVAPEIVKAVTARIKRNGAFPFLTETSTLYRGERSNAIDHLNHAFSHGFSWRNVGAPFIMADGLLGDSEVCVDIPGKIFQQVNIAREVVLADALITISHVTGHMHAAMGAGIKNLGMGLASRRGKMRQHSSIKPLIKPVKCTFCKQCIKWCPEDAIIEKEKKAFIAPHKCIGCGECLAVCKFDAVHYNWGTSNSDMQKKMAEHALGVIQEKRDKVFFMSYMINMTKDCDCMAIKQEKVIPDLGILASTDVVAIDQAALDLTRNLIGEDIGKKSYPAIDPTTQLEHGEAIGLGSRKYELIEF